MKDRKVSRLNTGWEEVRPAVFELRGYSVEQEKRLDRRPDELIRSAVAAAKKVRDEKNNKQ
jgi:hypothetical protein